MFTVSPHPCLKIKQEDARKGEFCFLKNQNSSLSPILLFDLYSEDCATVKDLDWHFDIQIK